MSASSTACTDAELRMLVCARNADPAPNRGIDDVVPRPPEFRTSTSELDPGVGDTAPRPSVVRRGMGTCGLRLDPLLRGLVGLWESVSVPALLRADALSASVIMFESGGEGGMDDTDGVLIGEDCAV